MATITAALRQTSPQKASPLAGIGRGGPPKTPRAAGGFSGRGFCRIYPSEEAWVLEVFFGGWAAPERKDRRKTFPTLTAAILYAVSKGFSYRVTHSETGARSASSAQGLTAATIPFAKNFSKGIDHRSRSPNS